MYMTNEEIKQAIENLKILQDNLSQSVKCTKKTLLEIQEFLMFIGYHGTEASATLGELSSLINELSCQVAVIDTTFFFPIRESLGNLERHQINETRERLGGHGSATREQILEFLALERKRDDYREDLESLKERQALLEEERLKKGSLTEQEERFMNLYKDTEALVTMEIDKLDLQLTKIKTECRIKGKEEEEKEN